MLMVCAAEGKVQLVSRARQGTFLHLITAEFDHELGADSISSPSWLEPFNFADMVVDIQPESTKWRRRRSIVEDQTSQSFVETEVVQLFNDGVDHGVFERDVDDLFAKDVRFDEYLVLFVGGRCKASAGRRKRRLARRLGEGSVECSLPSNRHGEQDAQTPSCP
jgi:hypothetical protein